MKLLSYDELKPLKGIDYSKVQLWRLEKARKFPKRIALSPNRCAWAEDEVDAWIKAKVAARDATQDAA
jgi:prophage regulatory protein